MGESLSVTKVSLTVTSAADYEEEEHVQLVHCGILLELVSDSLLAPIFATTTDDNSILETTGIV
jgi:hypothetical protein